MGYVISIIKKGGKIEVVKEEEKGILTKSSKAKNDSKTQKALDAQMMTTEKQASPQDQQRCLACGFTASFPPQCRNISPPLTLSLSLSRSFVYDSFSPPSSPYNLSGPRCFSFLGSSCLFAPARDLGVSS